MSTSPYRKPYAVDILVRGWENIGLTRRCLASIEHNTPQGNAGQAAGLDYNVIYVDNGSTVHLVAELMKDYPWVTFVRLPFNHGSVRAINVGLALALASPAPYVLLLDNDTAIPDGDHEWLQRFIGYLADETVGAAGAITNYVAGYQHAEALPPTYTRAWQADGQEGLKELPDMPVLVSFALLLRKSAIQQIGFMDERFEPGNFEDYDYTLRLRAKGWRCVLAPSVWIHHKGSQTFRRIGHSDLMAANQARLIEKWGVDKLAELGIEVQQAEAVPA